jgi:hypothetical protein
MVAKDKSALIETYVDFFKVIFYALDSEMEDHHHELLLEEMHMSTSLFIAGVRIASMFCMVFFHFPLLFYTLYVFSYLKLCNLGV